MNRQTDSKKSTHQGNDKLSSMKVIQKDGQILINNCYDWQRMCKEWLNTAQLEKLRKRLLTQKFLNEARRSGAKLSLQQDPLLEQGPISPLMPSIDCDWIIVILQQLDWQCDKDVEDVQKMLWEKLITSCMGSEKGQVKAGLPHQQDPLLRQGTSLPLMPSIDLGWIILLRQQMDCRHDIGR